MALLRSDRIISGLRRRFGISAPKLSVRTHWSWKVKGTIIGVAALLFAGLFYGGFDAAGPIGGTALSAANNSAGTNGLGRMQVGTLELSNVDLSQQFADMIITQRSFQAGSRVITVTDGMLEEVINLKR